MDNIKKNTWGGKRLGAGQKKQPTALVNEALKRCDQKFPEIYQTLIDKALGYQRTIICPHCSENITVERCNADANVAIYLVDRRLGKPHQSIDQRIKANVLVTADDYELATRLTQATEAKILNEYSVALLPETTDVT